MSQINLYSAVKYLGTDVEGDTRFTIPFPYLRREHIVVYRMDESVEEPVAQYLFRGADWDFADGSTIELAVPLPVNHSLTIRRFTEKDQRLANFNDGSNLTQRDLNDVTRQALYLIQEIDDYTRIQEQGIPGGTSGDPTQTLVDGVLDALFQTALFNDLVSLIDLVDINAENTMADILQNHEDWTLDERRDQQLDLLADIMFGTPASVDTLTNIQQSGDGTLASKLDFIQVNSGGNFGLVTELGQAFLGEQQATAERFELVAVNLDGNFASFSELAQAEATENSVVGLLVQEVNAKLAVDEFGNALAESSFIEAFRTGAGVDETGAYSAVADYINSQISTAVNDLNTTIAGVQTTATTAADEASANASVIDALAAQFDGFADDGSGDVDPLKLTAGIQNAYEVYADGAAAEAAATAVSELEANTVPIYFNSVPPDHTVEPYASGPFASNGFPDGAIWFKKVSGLNDTMLQFVFHRGLTFADIPNIEGITLEDLNTRIFFIEDNAEGQGRGAWIEQTATALGALVQEYAGASISEDEVRAEISNLVEGVYDNRVTAVEQTQTTFLGDDGYVNSQWMVRMNTYLGGTTPVVAGFGLGLESDPVNEGGLRSDFIVMADYFSLIAPPNDPAQLEDGSLDTNTVKVPFITDAQNSTVYINGDLFVEDNLYAYSGRLDQTFVGRAIFGQLTAVPGYTPEDPESNPDEVTSTWQNLVDPNGFRMELLSSTNGYWQGPSRDYIIWAGTGNRNDNNAVFYVDSEGNALFGGMVQAENISGSLSNVETYTVSENPWLHATSAAWVQVGPVQQFNITSLRLLRPVIMATVNMVHGRAGQAQLEIRHETVPGSGNMTSWTLADQGSCTMDRTDGQTQITLQGSVDANVRGLVEFRVRFNAPYGSFDIKCAGYRATAMALPASSTSATGLDTPDPDDAAGNDPGGSGPPPGGGIDPGGPGVIIEP